MIKSITFIAGITLCALTTYSSLQAATKSSSCVPSSSFAPPTLKLSDWTTSSLNNQEVEIIQLLVAYNKTITPIPDYELENVLKALHDPELITKSCMGFNDGDKDFLKTLKAALAESGHLTTHHVVQETFYTACERGHIAIAQALLNLGANPNTRNKKGITPLMLATKSNKTEFYYALLMAGADIYAETTEKEPRDRQDFFKQILNNGHSLENIEKALKKFSLAPVKPCIDTMRYEKALGVNLERYIKYPEDVGIQKRLTLLFQHPVVRTLLEIKLDDTRLMMYKAMWKACTYGHANLFNLLLQWINPNDANLQGKTFLMQAISQGHDTIVSVLLNDRDLIIDAVDNHGWTAMAHAIHARNSNAVALLAPRANLNQFFRFNGDNTMTPLMQATFHDDSKSVRTLLEYGAKSQLKNNIGLTALAYAARHNHHALAILLGRNYYKHFPTNGSAPVFLMAAIEDIEQAIAIAKNNNHNGLRDDLNVFLTKIIKILKSMPAPAA